MNSRFAIITFVDGGPVDPAFGRPGGGWSPTDPGYGRPGGGHPDQGLPGYGHPDQGLPIAPVRPSNPIVLPPNVWPPQLPPGVDAGLPLPPEAGNKPIVLPPDPDLGIEHPIVIPPLPAGVALLIALPRAEPKAGAPSNAQPAILVQAGKRPVLVYISAGPQPK